MMLVLLLTVQEYSEVEGGLAVVFAEGQRVRLPRTSPGYDSSHRALAGSNRTGGVVATEWQGSHHLVSISRARRDRVVALHRDRDGGLLAAMVRMSGNPRLPAGHPHLRRFSSMLASSMQREKDLWLALFLPEFTIADLRWVEAP
jgi:hypothetical protein